MKTRITSIGLKHSSGANTPLHKLAASLIVAGAALFAAMPAAAALDARILKGLAEDEGDAKISAISQLVATADPDALKVLQALAADALVALPDGRIAIVADGKMTDAATGAAIAKPPESPDTISIDNRIRGALQSGLAAMSLLSPDRAERMKSARELQGESAATPAMLPLLDRALAQETDAEIKSIVVMTRATLQLQDSDPKVRLSAVKTLADSGNPNLKLILTTMLDKNSSGQFNEPDEAVRTAARTSLRELESRLFKLEVLGGMFYGLSLGSILLLVALGLAITFGLMGIINMAHGELLMIGAYATYVVQLAFKRYLPEYFDWYLLASLPMAFITAAVVGMILERSVIRFLYGRPLETLLAT